MISLRPYQQQAHDAVLQEWHDGRHKTLLVLPTGTGKTIVFSKLLEHCVREGLRCLVLAHRGELLEQAAEKLQASTGLACATEKAEDTCLGRWERIVVGSVQSMMRPKRLAGFRPDHFDVIIVDEAHHALAQSYLTVIDYFSDAQLLGVTATPDRGDKRSLGQLFESIAFEYSISTAIQEGFLSPIQAMTIPLTLDISGVKSQAGDYQLAGLGTALDPYLESIADEMVAHCSDRKTVVFLPLIATAKKFRHILQQKGLRAAEVNGESRDRAATLEDFDAGKYDVLCNAMLLTEGWDCPTVDCIVVLRPTKIRSLYAQMVGRGTRPLPDKDNLLVLDFLWHTATHELCHPSGLICETADVAAKMTEIIAESPGMPADLEETEKQAEGDVIAEREEALAKQLDEMRKKKRKLVDPLQYEMSIGAEDLVDYQPAFGWELAPASDKQITSLEKAGIFADEIQTAGKASLLLDRVDKRRQAGLSTAKQIRFLEGKGFQSVGKWDKQAAGSMIARISASGWRIPTGIEPAEYKPEKAYSSDEYLGS